MSAPSPRLRPKKDKTPNSKRVQVERGRLMAHLLLSASEEAREQLMPAIPHRTERIRVLAAWGWECIAGQADDKWPEWFRRYVVDEVIPLDDLLHPPRGSGVAR